MSVRAGGAENMFLDVKELAIHKLRIRKTYAPGSIDFHSAEIKQVEPLEVTATAELLEGQIRIDGTLETKIELVCARCLEPVVEEVSRTFDLFYAPLPKDIKIKETRLRATKTKIESNEAPGLFWPDLWKNRTLLELPLRYFVQARAGQVSELPRNETAAPSLPALRILQGQSGTRGGVVRIRSFSRFVCGQKSHDHHRR